MSSGQDDVSFLRALVSHLRGSLSLPRMYLTGHSNGGMMANRMWCETGDSLFDGFVGLQQGKYVAAHRPVRRRR